MKKRWPPGLMIATFAITLVPVVSSASSLSLKPSTPMQSATTGFSPSAEPASNNLINDKVYGAHETTLGGSPGILAGIVKNDVKVFTFVLHRDAGDACSEALTLSAATAKAPVAGEKLIALHKAFRAIGLSPSLSNYLVDWSLTDHKSTAPRATNDLRHNRSS